MEYHIRAFERMCSLLKGYVNHIIVSFIDDYKNVRNHYDELKLKNPTHEDLKKIGIHFFDIANKNNMTVQTCYEKKISVNMGSSRMSAYLENLPLS